MMRFSARITEKSSDPSNSWIACELAGTNQDNKQILTGRSILRLPSRKQQ